MDGLSLSDERRRRRAYARGAGQFLARREALGGASIAGAEPLHRGTWIKVLARKVSAPTVKQRSPACGTCSVGW